MHESIANGFKKQFFKDIDVEISRLQSKATYLVNKTNQFSELKKWVEFSKQLPIELGDAVINFYNGGTEYKPYLALSLLDFDPNRIFNEWEEKSLCCFDDLFNYDTAFYGRYRAIAYISEHTIKRIFQRSFDLSAFQDKKITIFSILNEFKYVPLWSNYWPQFFYHLNQSHYSISTLKPVIPAPSGLFLCEYSTKNKFHLDIRTFVSLDQLKPDQTELRSVMLKAGKNLAQSQLSFRSTLLDAGLDYPIELIHKVSMGLVNKTKLIATQLSNDPNLLEHLKAFLILSIDRLEDYVFHEKLPNNINISKEIIKRGLMIQEKQ